MENLNISTLKQDAEHSLRVGREPKRVILWYAGLTTALAAILTLLNMWLDSRISGTGGLGSIGIRSTLSTVQALLLPLEMVLTMSLEMGYLNAMMRISRKQYADETDLKAGFSKFFPYLRLNILQGLLYFGIGMIIFYASMYLFLMTPLADKFITVVQPYLNSATVLNPAIDLDEQTLALAMKSLTPLLILFFAVFGIVSILVSYRLRMAAYVLVDDKIPGGIKSLRKSVKMMKGNCMTLFKVDLGFWWYYVLRLLCSAIVYLPEILLLVGIVIPGGMAVTLGLYGLYLAGLFLVNYFLRNMVECTYLSAYNALREKPKDTEVVLGNIFDMQ